MHPQQRPFLGTRVEDPVFSPARGETPCVEFTDLGSETWTRPRILNSCNEVEKRVSCTGHLTGVKQKRRSFHGLMWTYVDRP